VPQPAIDKTVTDPHVVRITMECKGTHLMTVPTILRTSDGPVTVLSLNRPERLNAVSEELYRTLHTALVDLDDDPDVRAVVVTGSGRAFCVGADLKAHRERTRSRDDQAEYCRQIQTMSTPVIAAVNGYAFGAGAEMAVSADFLVTAVDTILGFPEVKIGTFVGGGITQRLPRMIGLRKATELLLLGEPLSGRQAFECGLAYIAVPADQVLVTATSLAQVLAAKAPLSLGRLKTALQQSLNLDETLEMEADALLTIMSSRDWAEGVAAFAQRRSPVFSGR
jgi:enoyl-CoA hydratase/carnithine racemase